MEGEGEGAILIQLFDNVTDGHLIRLKFKFAGDVMGRFGQLNVVITCRGQSLIDQLC